MNNPTSLLPNDYEIMIRKQGENTYAAFCPQLNIIIKGFAHIEVEEAMKKHVLDYIESLKTA